VSQVQCQLWIRLCSRRMLPASRQLSHRPNLHRLYRPRLRRAHLHSHRITRELACPRSGPPLHRPWLRALHPPVHHPPRQLLRQLGRLHLPLIIRGLGCQAGHRRIHPPLCPLARHHFRPHCHRPGRHP
jgi:hypothetical protein